jgi:8-oxo-dGTP diphosphatase
MKIKCNNILITCIALLSVSNPIFSNQNSKVATQDIHLKHHKSPILTTAAIIEVYDNNNQFLGIVLIERGKEPWGKALPGGKVEYGETVEHAVRREMMEEVNLELSDLKQFHVYSDPTRDFRHHSVEVTYFAKAYKLPKAGDDAAKAFIVKLEDIPWDDLAFDHAQILKDYLEWKNNNASLCLINFDPL